MFLATCVCVQDKGRVFREAFLGKLSLLLRGTVAAPADRFGETLADEHMMGGKGTAHAAADVLHCATARCVSPMHCLLHLDWVSWLAAAAEYTCSTVLHLYIPPGAFTAGEGKPLVSPHELPNCNMRLYGGAQFHRCGKNILGVSKTRPYIIYVASQPF